MKYFVFLALISLFFFKQSSAQLSVVNKKGTVISVDSSKWRLSGSDIINKNTGNVGIGNSSPSYKLDVTGKLRTSDSLVANSARIITLNSGTTNDSIVVADATTGILKRISSSAITKMDSADNGLTLTGKKVQLGGNLTQATTITNNAFPLTIATAGTALNITGLPSGTTNDSVMMVTTAGVVKRISPSTITKIDSADNGLTLTGKKVQLGGNLTQATTITNNAFPLTIATAGTALNITGLPSGTTNDSVMMVTTAGVVKRISPSTITKIDSADNGLTLTGKKVQLGGNLTQATTITNNAFPLTIATAGTALNITGLPSGTTNDSVMMVTTAGVVKRISPSAITKIDSADNGLTLTGKKVQLGGSLTKATTITATATNTLAISGLQSGAAADSIVTIDNSTGVLKRKSFSNMLQTNNGISKNGDTTQLGGSLTKATTITATATNTLAISGLQSGTASDSIVTADNSTGILKRKSYSNILQTNNGISKNGDTTQLGGNLTKATTITSNANVLTFATGGTALKITGLTSATTNDSLLMITDSGVVKRISPIAITREPWNKIGGTTPSTKNADSIYITGNVSIGKSTNAAKLDVSGSINSDSTISAVNYTSKVQTLTSGAWNLNLGANASWTLAAGSNTLSITNVKQGMYGLIKLINNGTSTIVLPAGSKVINGGGGIATLTQASGAVDILTFFYDGSTYWWTIGNNYN